MILLIEVPHFKIWQYRKFQIHQQGNTFNIYYGGELVGAGRLTRSFNYVDFLGGNWHICAYNLEDLSVFLDWITIN